MLTALDELDRINADANEGREVALDEVEGLHDEASDALDGMFPQEWKESDTDADFDLAAISLDQMEAAINAGEREQAEQARLSAYAFFEFGPERFSQPRPAAGRGGRGADLVRRPDEQGLAELIANDGSPGDPRHPLALDERWRGP